MVLPVCVASLSLFVGCHRNDAVQVRFTVGAGAEPIKRLQLYVSDVELLQGDGSSQRLEIAANPPWQSTQVALLDLIGGQGDRNTTMTGSARGEAYTGIRFSVSVPFELNHANPLTASAPLNRAELFWNWQSGYKFLRLELTDAEHSGAFHLGSTGCSSASALRPPQQPCAQPNAMRVELSGFDPTRQPIELQLAELVAALRDGNHPACTGDYERDPACVAAFAMTGIDVRSGACTGERGVCSSQRLFAVGQ